MPQDTVLILHNEPRGGDAEHAESDAGVLREVTHVAEALCDLKVPCRVASVRTLRDVGQTLETASERCVVNLVESLEGVESDFCLVPAVCTAMGKTWTGNGTPCQLLALDKWQAKCALRAAGIPAPRGTVIPPGRIVAHALAVKTPVIVKPLRADASEGIDAESVFMDPDPDEVRERVRRMHDRFGQPALVEHYLDGREFNVSVLERNGALTVLPLSEIDFTAFPAGKPRIVGYRAKWIEDSFEYKNTPRRIPADVDEKTGKRIRDTALAAWKCFGCRDYARIDIRVSATDRPYVMEVNPNPDVSPDAGYAAALDAGGVRFADFVGILLENVGQRVERVPGDAIVATRGNGIQIRRSCIADREAILEIVNATRVFRPCELDVAREVLDGSLAAVWSGQYQSHTAFVNETVAGWACFGPTPCTSGTFDLYWLAVHPEYDGRGVGTTLLLRAEAEIQARSGRLIVIETSSRVDYEPARRFYEYHGYRRAGTVSDFYERGDDKLVYVKALEAATQS